MSETIRVRVKYGKTGFYGGKFRGENKRGMDEFVLEPVTHSTKVDDEGELVERQMIRRQTKRLCQLLAPGFIRLKWHRFRSSRPKGSAYFKRADKPLKELTFKCINYCSGST